jgi:hypothetical protein
VWLTVNFDEVQQWFDSFVLHKQQSVAWPGLKDFYFATSASAARCP